MRHWKRALLLPFAAGGANPLLTGLVSYWTLNETSGNRADSVGTNTLAPLNAPGSAAGIISNAATFTAASSQNLHAADSTSLHQTTALSVSLWFKLTSIVANQAIGGRWTYQTDGDWMIQLVPVSGDNIRVFIANAINDNGSNFGDTSGLGLTTATWYHLAVVYDGTQGTNAGRLKIYLNAIAQTLTFTGTIAAALTGATTQLRWGQFGGGLDRFLDGALDEIGLWSRVLSAAEVTQLYNGGAGKTYPFT